MNSLNFGGSTPSDLKPNKHSFKLPLAVAPEVSPSALALVNYKSNLTARPSPEEAPTQIDLLSPRWSTPALDLIFAAVDRQTNRPHENSGSFYYDPRSNFWSFKGINPEEVDPSLLDGGPVVAMPSADELTLPHPSALVSFE